MGTVKEYTPDSENNAAGPTEHVKLKSDIQDFFRGKNVFLTGGTGFLGILLIEKLIRACQVNKVFLLIRSKRGKDIEKRLEDLINEPVFEKIRNEIDVRAKLQAVNGDCSQISLGLQPEDLQMVINNTDIVIHSAATVRFDEKLRVATNINVRGTLELLKICKKMPNLLSFNHISTAYSNCTQEVIEEKIYPSAMYYEYLISLVHISTDQILDNITKYVLGKYPNTYVFTKQIAESVVQKFAHDVPVSIVRPSTIVATAEDPIPGWINNVYGLTGVMLGGALGLLRILYADPDTTMDIVPADYSINLILAATYVVGAKYKENPQHIKKVNHQIPVYHVVSGARNPIDLKSLMKYGEEIGVHYLSPKIIWHFGFWMTRNYLVFLLYTGLFHFIPGAIADTILIILRKKPILWKIYKKILKFTMALTYFTMRTFNLPDTNALALYNSLSARDRRLFNFDLASIKWYNFMKIYIPGIRLYVLRDPLDTVPQGRIHAFRLKILHYTVVTIIWSLLIWYIIVPTVSSMAAILGFYFHQTNAL